MERCINLVGTHIVDGDRGAALAWYADHVQQLLADPALEAAVLYERVDGGVAGQGSGRGMEAPSPTTASDVAPAPAALRSPTPVPDMVCLYDFVTRERFDAYEAGPVRAAAAVDRAAGWGRDGIDIALREMHWRVARVATGAHGTDAPAECRITAWRGASMPTTVRALAAGLLAAGASLWWLLRADAGDGFVVAHAPVGVDSPTMGELTAAWQGRYVRRMQWCR